MPSTVMVGRIEQRQVDQLAAYAKNARTHSKAQIDRIAASIREFGFVNPILVGPDDVIIAGHARLLAARKLGLLAVPVIVLAHLSATQRRALVIADNQLALNAGWDTDLLRAELAALVQDEFNVELLGFDDGELARLLASQEAVIDPDKVPAPPQFAATAAGDLWRLGEHRLLCGDATRIDAIENVLGGAFADMVFADTPDQGAWGGDGTAFAQVLREACRNILAVCRGAVYVMASDWSTLLHAFVNAGGHCATFLIWAKQHSTFAPALDYQREYEIILYGWPTGANRPWYGSRDQSDVWFIPPPRASRANPTVKPVELVERAIQNNSLPGDRVLDPFAGSGTTLIACERRKRRACLLEIDPRSADLICQRWQQFTGKPAILDADAHTFDEVAQQRQQQAA